MRWKRGFEKNLFSWDHVGMIPSEYWMRLCVYSSLFFHKERDEEKHMYIRFIVFSWLRC